MDARRRRECAASVVGVDGGSAGVEDPAVDRWLVIDTATPVAVVGVVDLDGGGCVVVDEVLLTETRRHAERLPEVVGGLMETHGATLSGIGAGAGPGSFIGIRTGLAFAKGLARARSLPLVGISTLAALVLSDDDVNRSEMLDQKADEIADVALIRLDGHGRCTAFGLQPDRRIPAALRGPC